MGSVHVTRTIPAPTEDVFDLLADHANYDRFRAIDGSKLLRRRRDRAGHVHAAHQAPASVETIAS